MHVKGKVRYHQPGFFTEILDKIISLETYVLRHQSLAIFHVASELPILVLASPFVTYILYRVILINNNNLCTLILVWHLIIQLTGYAPISIVQRDLLS